MTQSAYYAQLEQGARYLAALAKDEAERQRHLGWANRYCRLADEYAPALMTAPAPARAVPATARPMRAAPAFFS